MNELKLECAACGKEKLRDDMAAINRRGTKINGKMINVIRAVCKPCSNQGYDTDGLTNKGRAVKINEE